MTDQKKTSDQFYVVATSSLTEEKTYVLKHNDSFGIFNKYGDIMPTGKSAQGLYHDGTRYLSDLQLKIENQKPLFLSSDIREDNELFTVDLTNPDVVEDNRLRLEKGMIHILRKKVLWDRVFYEQIIFSNYGLDTIESNITINFDNDFNDIFEVRGTERPFRGSFQPAEINENQIILSYTGLDNCTRKTDIHLSPNPEHLSGKSAKYLLKLAPGQKFNCSLTIIFKIQGQPESEVYSFPAVMKKYSRRLEYIESLTCEIFTSNEQFNHWINRSKADLVTMITDTPAGPYPYAGIP